MAQSVEESDDSPPMGSEWLEQAKHFLVGPAVSTGQVMDDDVLDVEVADCDLVGIAM